MAFDVYHIKIKLIKEYANSLMEVCKAYINEAKTESVDYLSMNSQSIKNAEVLD